MTHASKSSFPCRNEQRLTNCCQFRNPNFYSRRPTTHAWLTPQNAAYFVQTNKCWPTFVNSRDPNSIQGKPRAHAWLTLLNPAFLMETSRVWQFAGSQNSISGGQRLTHYSLPQIQLSLCKRTTVDQSLSIQETQTCFQESQRLTDDSRF